MLARVPAFFVSAALMVPATAFAAPPSWPKPAKPSLPGAKPGGAKIPGRLGGTRPALETDSILSLQLKQGKAKKKGSLASFGSKKVELTPGKQVSLSTIATDAFKEHRDFARNLGRAKSGATYGAIKSSTEVYEFNHSFVMVRSTGVTVADAKEVKRKAPIFGRLTDGKKHVAKRSKLNAESKAGLAKFKKEVAKYPASHPLRLAAAKGEQALLDALASGVGYVEVVDTLHIPKKAPKVTAAGLAVPKLTGGKLDYSKTRPLPGTKHIRFDASTLQVSNPSAAAGLGNALGAAAAKSVSGGGQHQTAEFLAGQTWSESWVWERRWNVPSGFLRVTFGASYAVGLRVPIEVKTQASPMWVCDNGIDRERNKSKMKLRVKAEAIDGDAAFYRRAGLRGAAVANGNELALQASIGYGYKLRLFWTTLANQPYRESGLDKGQNFNPPQGSQTTKVVDVFLPASWTNTSLSAGPLRGSVRLGFKIDVSGKVRTRVTALQESTHLTAVRRPSGSSNLGQFSGVSPQLLTASNAGWKEYEFRLKNRPRQLSGNVPSYQDNYGFRIDNVDYDSSWSVVPGVEVNASARYAGYGIGGTWTFWLDAARLPIGSLKLGHHRGTRRQHENMSGVKIWHRNRSGDTQWCAQNNPNV